jgi:putative ubiquitin-RnfH superfamily antitoxin RatB of RatAB toxin-antitoxin module
MIFMVREMSKIVANSLSTIEVELCDTRVLPPQITVHQIKLNSKKLETTLLEALEQIGLVTSMNDPIFLKKGSVGVFGVPLTHDATIYAGDRIELYRPILIDPKTIRRKKANQNKDAVLQEKAKKRAISRAIR